MAVWTYVPENVFAETQAFDVRAAQVTPSTRIVGRETDTGVRAFRLQYGIVSSSDLAGMAAFYTARRGPWAAFSWVHPSDSRAYTVRFDSNMRLELFQPTFWRTGADVVLEVVDGG